MSVLADQQGWVGESGELDAKFGEPVVTFPRLRQEVRDGVTDAFLWEYFMTKPFVDSKELAFAGTVSAPWPAFMVAARSMFARDNASKLRDLLQVIAEGTRIFKQEREASIARVSASFGIQLADAAEWFENIHYSDTGSISSDSLRETVAALKKARVLTQECDVNQLVDTAVAIVE